MPGRLSICTAAPTQAGVAVLCSCDTREDSVVGSQLCRRSAQRLRGRPRGGEVQARARGSGAPRLHVLQPGSRVQAATLLQMFKWQKIGSVASEVVLQV